ncbi:MAG TPA: FKBP-type peptidyl-prolyl cis-trans isomerase, partial [Nitrospiria bacterium]|nr:FKBP-type peptidyl-prolyl cis-trans isomerase [Nitrospiria bacterium]
TLEDKSVVDSNVGAEPLIFTQGSHHIIPGLENGLEGMKTGEVRQVTVKPEEGYGVIDQEAFVEVNKEELPAEGLTVGAHIQGEDANGQVLHAQIKEIKDKTVILDFNHPLAGKTLYFDVKIVGIQEVK